MIDTMKTDEKRSSKLADLMVNESGFVFDQNTGESFQLNESGVFCLRALREGENPQALAERLAKEHSIDELRAKSDVDLFLWELEQLNWI